MRVYRGEVYLVDFGIGYGSEQGGVRTAVIVQNNISYSEKKRLNQYE